MREELLLRYTNKKVRLFLANGRVYTGTVLSTPNGFCEILDKFGIRVLVYGDSIQNIEFIDEEKESGENGRRKE